MPKISPIGIILFSAGFLLSVGVVGGARADIASTFETGNDGWAVVAYPFRSNGTGGWATSPLPFDGATGNPAGSVRVGDVYGETGITAPAPFLGDKSSFYGGQLSYDLLIRFSDGVTYPAVVLVGASLSVYYDAPPPAVGVWESRAVPLTETGWRIGGTNAEVSQAEFLNVLQTLAGLHIYTEWHTGADDTSVDNIVLHGQTTPVAPDAGVALAVASFPNPFNPRTTIRFELPDAGPVTLVVHDLAGRRVRALVSDDMVAGRHVVPWDGCDEAGQAVASGLYLARLEQGAHVAAVRMALVR